MHINWMSNSYWQSTGYGRYSAHMARALIRQGVDVRPMTYADLTMPKWMQRQVGIDMSRLTIACLPPYNLPDRPHGRMWLLTMTEGSDLPRRWADCIVNAGVERVIVPCRHNVNAYRTGGVRVPIHVVPGGTDPTEFPLLPRNGHGPEAYTFLALGDRGTRKGWMEVWEAFYAEFGTPDDTPDVHLIIKVVPYGNDLIERMAKAQNKDPRIEYWIEEVPHTSDIWQRADCVVIPSRTEGWGMPHREASIMGVPTIVPRHSGLDDGHTDDWATVVLERYQEERINVNNDDNIRGDWYRMDVDEIRQAMRYCYENPGEANEKAQRGAMWLRHHQTWDHAAQQLIALLEEYV